MSLILHMPLIGSLDNLGTEDFTIANTGAAVDTSDGKIGVSCYNFNGKAIEVSRQKGKFWNEIIDGDYTISCWIKGQRPSGQGYSVVYGCGNDGRNAANKMWGLWINSAGILNFQLPGTTRTTDNYCNFSPTSDTWTHVVVVHEREHLNKLKWYINGKLYTTSTANSEVTPNYTVKNFTDFYIGNREANNSTWYFDGKIQDFRIYDEALSAKEVRLIARGLVAHYKLDNDGRGGDNLFIGTGVEKTGTNYGYGYYDYLDEDVLVAGETYTITACFKTSETTTATYIAPYLSKGDASQCKFNLGADYQNGVKTVCSKTFVCRYASSRTPDVNRDHGRLILYRIPSDGSDWTLYWVKVEKGAKATPWCPHKSDAIYSALGYDSAIEYDCSGYGNHGTRVGTFTGDTDAPRNLAAYDFIGSNYVRCGRGGMVTDEITVNIWAYMDDWSGFSKRLISCTESGGWNFEPSGGYMQFPVLTANSEYYTAKCGTALAELSAGWHMFTGTYDGYKTCIYIDGALDGTKGSYSAKTKLKYNAANGIFIGAEAGTNTTTPNGAYFSGKLSDCRIYGTALSADAIRELYEMAASITDTGGILAYGFTEMESQPIRIGKDGVANHNVEVNEDDAANASVQKAQLLAGGLMEI